MNALLRILKLFDEKQSTEEQKQVCIGFDGYVDTLYRVIKSRSSRGEYEAYSTIRAFADRVYQAAGRSADMELQRLSRRMGGNAPLMAEAMSRLGVSARCIGTMGYPELDDVFTEKLVHFTPVSVAPSASSIAFEFSDGKLMFGHTEPLLTLDWDKITGMIGLEMLRQWYRDSDLWAVVNWSFLLRSNEILEGFIRDVVEVCEGNHQKIIFFDLADPSGRSWEDLQNLFALLRRMSAKARVVLSMNENESSKVAEVIGLPNEDLTAVERVSAIRDKLGIWMAVIHGLDYAAAATEGQTVFEKGVFVPAPRISTGGGDHFNGGFAAALLYGLSHQEATAFGNLVSSCYVSEGNSPTLQNLHDYVTMS